MAQVFIVAGLIGLAVWPLAAGRASGTHRKVVPASRVRLQVLENDPAKRAVSKGKP
jgi:hypothetical protein